MSETTDAGGLLTALLAVQSEAPTLKKDATNPAFKGSTYAPLDTIVETIRPILARHGLVWSTMPSFDEASGEPTLKYKLAHAPSREFEQGEMKLLLSKGDPQGQGSAITYARRYALVSVLNLVADDDDDGNAASQGRSGYGRSKPAAPKPAPDPEHVAEVKRLVRKNKVKTHEIRVLLRGAGLSVTENDNPVPLVQALTEAQAAAIVDVLKTQPVPTGASDATAPGDGDGFVHPPAGDDETIQRPAPEVPS